MWHEIKAMIYILLLGVMLLAGCAVAVNFVGNVAYTVITEKEAR